MKSNLSVFLNAAVGLGGVALVACSSSGDAAQTPAPGVDSSVAVEAAAETPAPDTAKSEVVVKEIGPVVCDQPLSADFACGKVTRLAGSTNCTEAALQAYTAACWKPMGGTDTTCKKWKSDYASCSTCVTSWTYSTSGSPNRDACYYARMTDTCANAVKCYFDCIGEVCADCDSSAGSKENSDCQKRAQAKSPKGLCYDIAYKTAGTCFDSVLLDPCIVNELKTPTGGTDAGASADPTKLTDELLQFFRGACRDNADWTNATSATSGDAGTVVDSGGDAGATVDSGAEASATADAGTSG